MKFYVEEDFSYEINETTLNTGVENLIKFMNEPFYATFKLITGEEDSCGSYVDGRKRV